MLLPAAHATLAVRSAAETAYRRVRGAVNTPVAVLNAPVTSVCPSVPVVDHPVEMTVFAAFRHRERSGIGRGYMS